MDSQNDVRLLVKAPDQQFDDQTVECNLDWTVARLKDHFALVYPSKPKREDQKIIFSGQVLNDSTILKDVLHQCYYNIKDCHFTVHLVCGGQSKANNTVNTTSTTQPSSPVQQYYSQLNNQQMAWMQQAYAHYLTRYVQIMSAQGTDGEITTLYAQTLGDNNIGNNAEEIDTAGDNEAAAARAEVEANPANNPAEEAPAAPLNRDWLDVFDMLSRIAVLSSIVYFYSSPSRFLTVTFIGFAFYLIQGGFLRGQFIAAENARHPNNPPQQPAPPPQPAAVPEQPQPQIDVGRTNMNEERPGAWAFTWTFFISFFASLIPDQPNV